MSTRCNIIIQEINEKPIILYHHHDGYPQGVGFDLHCRLEQFLDNWHADDIANSLVKDLEDEYEITTDIHGDIEYLYVIECEQKELRCFETWGRKIEKEVKLNFNQGDIQ